MSRHLSIILLVIGCQASAVTGEPVIAEISSDTDVFDLNPYLEYLPDEDGRWTIDDVSKPPLADKLKQNAARVFSAGFTATPYWYRLTLPSPSRYIAIRS